MVKHPQRYEIVTLIALQYRISDAESTDALHQEKDIANAQSKK